MVCETIMQSTGCNIVCHSFPAWVEWLMSPLADDKPWRDVIFDAVFSEAFAFAARLASHSQGRGEAYVRADVAQRLCGEAACSCAA